MSDPQSNDDQAYGILEWMMTQFSNSFTPEKMQILEELFAKAKEEENAPWKDDPSYNDPIVHIVATNLAADDHPFFYKFNMLCGIVNEGKMTVKQMFMAFQEYVSFHPSDLAIQGRTDWALHFIMGGTIESVLGLGQAAGAFKEWTDAFDGGDVDANDYAATYAGARFVQLAATQGVADWATGHKDLLSNLPVFNFVTTQAETDSGEFSPETQQLITAAVEKSLNPPTT